MRSNRLFVIDGSSFIYRAFHSIPPMANGSGLPTNAILGFTNILLKLLREQRPEYVVVAMDAGRRTFRNALYPEYKANRGAPPDNLIPQFPYFRKMLDALNVKQIEVQGYEADDVIATMCDLMESVPIVVVTPDKDLMQLVSPMVTLYDPARGHWSGTNEVFAKFGVGPAAVVDVMGLTGDAVDNIPGVKGIGPKTAAALINRFDDLEGLFFNLEEVKETRFRRMLEAGKDNAYLSRDLATARRDVPMVLDLNQLHYTGADTARVGELFEELEFGR